MCAQEARRRCRGAASRLLGNEVAQDSGVRYTEVRSDVFVVHCTFHAQKGEATFERPASTLYTRAAARDSVVNGQLERYCTAWAFFAAFMSGGVWMLPRGFDFRFRPSSLHMA